MSIDPAPAPPCGGVLTSRPGKSTGEPEATATMDAEPIDSVYRVEAPRLVRFFRRHAQDHDEAHDLVQDVFLNFTKARPAGLIANPSAFLQRIACNLLANRRRHRRRWARLISDQRIEDDLASVAASQDHWIEAEDIMEQYRRAVDALPPRTRTVFLLHRIEERSYREIAVELGISVKTVEYHIALALKRINAALEGE